MWIFFADDTNLFVAGSSLVTANSTATGSTNCLNYWLIANKLSLNIDKTSYMVFPSDTDNSTRVIVDGQETNKSQQLSLPGCCYRWWTETDRLTIYIQRIYSKLLKYTSISYKLRAKVPSGILLNIYYAFVDPQFCWFLLPFDDILNLAMRERVAKDENKLLQSNFCQCVKILTA